MPNSSQANTTGNLHVLTLTSFYPSDRDDASGCFVAEPLDWLTKIGIRNTVIAVQPIYRGSFQGSGSHVPAQWLR